MNSELQRGYLVLADISGYTSYLVNVELDHAQAILAELLDEVVEKLRPCLKLAKLEGDAVFAYAPEIQLTRGENLLDVLEATYAAFRDRMDGIHRRTTCECKACSATSTLDLKFVVHFGDYFAHRVSNGLELVGADVTLAHRLMKNRAFEVTGWSAYVLFSENALVRLGAQPEVTQYEETYDHFGAIAVRCMNLRPGYDESVAARRVFVAWNEADSRIELTAQVTPPVLWEWLNDPLKRAQWEGLDIRPVFLKRGRTIAGARNHCIHGKDVAMVETILDWRPFDYFTVDKAVNQFGLRAVLRVTSRLKPMSDKSSSLVVLIKIMESPMLPFLRPLSGPLMALYGLDKQYRDLVWMAAR
jgi:Protein of unknown function (DUF2652)